MAKYLSLPAGNLSPPAHIPSPSVTESVVLRRRIFLLCVLSVIPALLIVYATMRMLGKPIKRLEQAIVEVGEGKLDMVSEDLEVREFRELMHRINEMKVDIKNLLGKVQTEEEQRQKTEREKLPPDLSC